MKGKEKKIRNHLKDTGYEYKKKKHKKTGWAKQNSGAKGEFAHMQSQEGQVDIGVVVRLLAMQQSRLS